MACLFPALHPWMDDDGNNDAVEGSFYKGLLVTEDVELRKKCKNFDCYNDKGIEVGIEYDLKLKKGLNLVQYQLGSIYKTDPNIGTSFPAKIKITNAFENPEVIWIAKYFF